MIDESTIERLRAAREGGAFSRWAVARKLGISSQKLHRIEGFQIPNLPETFADDYRRALRDLESERAAVLDERIEASVEATVGSAR